MPRKPRPHPLDEVPEDLLEEIRNRPGAGSLTPEAVARFRQIVAKENGVVLSHKQAWEQARSLLDLVRSMLEWSYEDEATSEGKD